MATPLLPITYLFGDKRSYLYPGKSKNQLTPAERQLEALYDRIDRPGYRITAQQFYQTPEAMQLLDQLYGGLTDRIPPGSQIVSETPGKVTYRDAEGYEHNIIRKPSGEFTETTNRPSILPDKRREAMLDFLQQRTRQGLEGAPALANLDPETAAQLQAISDAERADIQKQGAGLEGQLLARLYGNRVNQSSIANEAGARFAEGLGRVQQQQAAGAAQRTLGLRQFLTNLLQQQGEQAGSLYANLTGQGTQRDIAGAGLDVELKRLAEGSRQFDLSHYLEQLRTQLEQQKMDAYNSPLNQLSRLIGVGTQLAGAAGGGLSAYRALTGGR